MDIICNFCSIKIENNTHPLFINNKFYCEICQEKLIVCPKCSNKLLYNSNSQTCLGCNYSHFLCNICKLELPLNIQNNICDTCKNKITLEIQDKTRKSQGLLFCNSCNQYALKKIHFYDFNGYEQQIFECTLCDNKIYGQKINFQKQPLESKVTI